jgi:SH3 domain protein
MLYKKISLILLVLLLVPGWVHGRNLYVTDEFQITMRTGPSLQNRVIRMLNSGTPLEVLDESSDWFQIRTSDGGEGWVLKQYTMQRTPRADMVQQLEKKVAELEDRAKSNEQKAAVLDQENTELLSLIQEAQQELEELHQKYQTLQQDSGNIEGIKMELLRTSNELASDREKLSQLSQKYQELRSQKNLHWFLAGGGAMGITALIGFFLGRIQRKKSKKFYF